MSLRGFHLFFMSVITLFCAVVTLWVFQFVSNPSSGLYFAGITCGLLALITPPYGIYFYKKMKKHSL